MFSMLYVKNTFSSISLINKLQVVHRTLTKHIKCNEPVFCKLFHSSPHHTCKTESTRLSTNKIDTEWLNLNTNVQNNVVLFKYQKDSHFRRFQFFTIAWMIGAITILYYSYTPLFYTLLRNSEVSWKGYFRQCGLQLMTFVYATIMDYTWTMVVLLYFLLCLPFCIQVVFTQRLSVYGAAVVGGIWVMMQRIIKYIILHKGGKEVTLITYHLFKKEVVLTVPTQKVKGKLARDTMKNYIPLKVQGKPFHYLLDSNGTFLNGKLFDCTVGAAKNW